MNGDVSIGPAVAPPPTSEELLALADEAAALEAMLRERERELAALRAELRSFEMRYTMAVRPRYAELERIEAEIAEALAALCPDDEALQEEAREARRRADASAGDRVEELPDAEEATGCHTPTPGLKRLYRRLAFETHPDRTGAAGDAELRHELMVEANRAYRDGDEELLEALLSEIEIGSVLGATGEHGRVLRRMAYFKRRVVGVEREFDEVRSGEMFDLWRDALMAAQQGRDAISEKASELDRRLKKARARLGNLAE